jgi:hypothetical protein
MQFYFSSVLWTTHPIWTPLGSNPDVHGEKSSTNYLSITMKFHVTDQLYGTEPPISTSLSQKPVTLIHILNQCSPVNITQIYFLRIFYTPCINGTAIRFQQNALIFQENLNCRISKCTLLHISARESHIHMVYIHTKEFRSSICKTYHSKNDEQDNSNLHI